MRRTASALEARASLLHAVETPAIDTAIDGDDGSPDGCRSDPGASTSASDCLPRRVRDRCWSEAVMGAKSTDVSVPNGGTPPHLG